MWVGPKDPQEDPTCSTYLIRSYIMYQTNSTNNKGGIHNDLPIDLTLPIDRILILAFLGELSVENKTTGFYFLGLGIKKSLLGNI